MGRQIGHFEILRRLEVREHRACYLGRDTRDGSSVLIDTWSSEPPEERARFLGRAEAASRLAQGSIARILDFGVDGDMSCRIEQGFSGELLVENLSRGGPPSVATALGWLAGIATTLDDAHREGVVHGNLHPEAIVVDGEGRALLRAFANPRPEGPACYCAPELRRVGVRQDDRAETLADTWSFGMLAFRVLTSGHAGESDPPAPLGSGARRRLRRRLKAELGARGARGLLSALDDCLAGDPAHRPATLGAVVAALPGVPLAQAEEDHREDLEIERTAVSAAVGERQRRAEPVLQDEQRQDVQPLQQAEPQQAEPRRQERFPGGEVETPRDDLPVRDPASRGESDPLDMSVRGDSADDPSLIELEIGNGLPTRHDSASANEPVDLPDLAQVAAAQPPRGSRFRRRWLSFGVVAIAALWLGGTLWSSKDSPIGSLVGPGTSQSQPDPHAAVAALSGAPDSAGAPQGNSHAASGAPRHMHRAPEAPASRGVGRLAVAPSWHQDITVAVNGQAPVALDSRRMFEVEAEREHVLTFELATRDYQIREQVTTRVGQGRLLEVPVPLQRPGAISILGASERERPVFVRVGHEAIGWTPIHDLVVPAGQHTLSLLRNPTWKPDERYDHRIRVESRQQMTVHIDFRSEPPAVLAGDERHELVLQTIPSTSAAVSVAALPASND